MQALITLKKSLSGGSLDGDEESDEVEDDENEEDEGDEQSGDDMDELDEDELQSDDEKEQADEEDDDEQAHHHKKLQHSKVATYLRSPALANTLYLLNICPKHACTNYLISFPFTSSSPSRANLWWTINFSNFPKWRSF